jgi:hypothetical protein
MYPPPHMPYMYPPPQDTTHITQTVQAYISHVYTPAPHVCVLKYVCIRVYEYARVCVYMCRYMFRIGLCHCPGRSMRKVAFELSGIYILTYAHRYICIYT